MQQDGTTSADHRPSLMPAIVLAALGGGPLTAVLLWQYGAALALLAAPLGASMAGSAAALLIYVLRREPHAPSAALAASSRPRPRP